MRIMATSDLHGNLEGLDPKGADVVVLAGDVAPLRGRGPWHINDQKKWKIDYANVRIPMSKTPSDHRAALNTATDIANRCF